MDLLQSDGWEQFQRALGRRTRRIDGVLAIEMPLPFGLTYLYAPRASAATSRQLQAPSPFCESLQRVAAMESAVFFRMPFTVDQLAACSLQLRAPAVMRRLVEPEWTWRTSLAESDTTRMAAMHEKHRYNIRLAERRGVRVNQYSSESVNQERFEACWTLLQDTAKRQGIATHPRMYYETMLRELSCKLIAASHDAPVGTPTQSRRDCKPDADCRLYIAEHDGAPLAAAIVAYHGDTATYLHGGSSYEHRSFMAPHLLHVNAMCDAKAAGMRWYDFGGIEPPKTETLSNEKTEQPESAVAQLLSPSVSQSAHAWAGMTRFKQGFGGEAVHHPPIRDLVFRPGWYRLLSFLARLRN